MESKRFRGWTGRAEGKCKARFRLVTESAGGGRDKLQQAGLNSARRDTVEIFEIAGEVRGLFVAEIIGDELDLFAVLEAGIGKAEAQLTEEFPDGDLIMFDEMALEGAERNPASLSEVAWAEIGLVGEGFPIGLVLGRRGGRGRDGRLPQTVEGDVRD